MSRAWLKAVENRREAKENPPALSTASTGSLSKIPHSPVFIPTFSLAFSQAKLIFTQLFDLKFPLLGWFSYTLSTAPTAAIKLLNKY